MRPLDGRRLRLLDAFAQLIANSERHHHNVALFPEREDATATLATRYRLAPAFDQLPMIYAPTRDGQVVARQFVLPRPVADNWEVRDEAGQLARRFWQQASELDELSTEMRAIASGNLATLA